MLLPQAIFATGLTSIENPSPACSLTMSANAAVSAGVNDCRPPI